MRFHNSQIAALVPSGPYRTAICLDSKGNFSVNTRSRSNIEQQTRHFNRALAQITPSWRCPELYGLRDGAYVPNPHVPLQWTQANLLVALQGMRATIGAPA